jgi:DNA-binding response OmpR family regulator
VPAPPQSSARTASHRNILLLEEYDALAAAIGSALKKFAPQHATSVARSLAEAEKLAAKIDPELFVIDVDPPWPNLTDLLETMRGARPDARVLVIGAAIPAEIAAERGSFGALQFVEKPFELAAFGAAVQALLGPWRESESSSPRGSLHALNSIDVVLLHRAAGANVIVDVRAGDKRSGEIHISEGQVSHAEAGKVTGVEALREILSWSNVRMGETTASTPARRTIQWDWSGVLLETLREAKARHALTVPIAKEPTPARRRREVGKKIVVIDDTEMLLIFVEDVLATADPGFQIATALSGIDGIKQIERVNPDLVLLDYSLPDINGDEVCRRLLQNERTAQVPVLMMSGHVAEMREAAACFENVVATIEKPFLSDALISLVQRTLEAGPRVRMKSVESAAPAKIPTPVPSVAPQPRPARPKKEALTFSPPSTASALAPEEFELQRHAPGALPVVGVAPGRESEAVLGLFLEVMSMQLTPQLQMGAIRAKPASLTVSLHLPSPAARNAIPAETGFQLGATELDGNGRISSIRLIPTAKPFQAAQTRNSFEIGGVAIIPNETRARVQLTPAGSTPMTIQLLAHLELAAVELSPTFQVAQLILKWRTNAVRVTLNPKAAEQSGANFAATAVKLDNSSRIAELFLNSTK